jgi:hypothetical protein
MERSSSTIQTGFMAAVLILSWQWQDHKHESSLLDGQAQREYRAPRPAGAFDGAVMLLDEILGHGQPQAAAPSRPETSG